MWFREFILMLALVVVLAKREGHRSHINGRSNSGDKSQSRGQSRKSEDNEDSYSSNNVSCSPTTTDNSPKGEAIVEKFVETLITSEKYLKMIETMEKRLQYLETSFHERTNTMLKYLSELTQMVKASSPNALAKGIKAMKSDLEKLKTAVADVRDSTPNLRANDIFMFPVEGQDYHIDGTLDTRLSTLESNVKSVVAGVQSILATIAEVKSRQYTRTFAKSDTSVHGTNDALSLINEFRRTLLEQKTKRSDCKMGRFDRTERYPTDCHEIQMQGFNVSGIYKIKPDDIEPFYVLCDLTTAGGGWTVFQNRFDGSQDFYKTWLDYKHGFGNLAGEFWLGLEKLNYLTNQKLYELRIEMETQHGQEANAGYSVFTVGPEYEGYRISTLGTYYGTAGDSMAYHAGQKYSTMDVDNDEWNEGSCASEHGGAWWYKECDKSNLNGRYTLTTEEQGQSMYWISFKGPNSQLSKTKMMIRPLPASKPVVSSSSKKIFDKSKLRGPHDSPKSVRTKEMNTKFDIGRAPYRFDEPSHADAFFPNYA